MKIIYKKIYFLVLWIVLSFLPPYDVNALEIEKYPSFFGLSITKSSDFIDYARYFFNAGMAIAGFLAVIVIVIGGIYYLISFNRGKFTDEGKQWIKAGVFGLILLVSAYLIAYTINPDLIDLRLQKLFAVGFGKSAGYQNSYNIPSVVYEEIPLGALTENLLSRTIDCYNFDENGDPIKGDEIETDNYGKIVGPTYLDHDRVDCFLKLSQAIEKKVKITEELSKKIVDFMKLCNCGGTSSSYDCRTNCAEDGSDCSYPETATCPIDKNCIGSTNPCRDTCSDIGCSCYGKNCESCPKDSGIKAKDPKTGKETEKNLSVKEVIEYGPIKIADCAGTEKEYLGLSEFRSQFNNNYEQIKNKVEIQPPAKINDKPISIINNGNCQTCEYNCGCDYDCPVCVPKSPGYYSCMSDQRKCEQKKEKCLKDQPKCNEEEADCKKKRLDCLKKNSPWYNLRIIDQITYLEGKLEEIRSSVESDINQLNKGRSTITNCYLVKSSVDLLQLLESTEKDEKIILRNRSFGDIMTGKVIDSSKYCEGFNYTGSVCYSKCQNICPETLSLKNNLKNYESCDGNCDEKKGNEKEKCLTAEKKCLKEYYDNRECPKNYSDFKTFPECMDNCKQQCLDACDQNYSCSQEELKKCKEGCNNDSKCLLENEEKCVVNFLQLKECVQTYKDPDNLKNCMESSFLCKYCSDQYAGYPDCVNIKQPNQSQNSEQYSSSYLYQNPYNQKCYPNPYLPNKENKNVTCLEGNPEITKCPIASMCPNCPCGVVNETIKYLPDPVLPESPEDLCSVSSPDKNDDECPCPGGIPGTSSCYPPCKNDDDKKTNTVSNYSEKINEYRVCSADCGKFTYVGDPLTFYCRNSWEPEAPLTGKWSNASPADEIPVGQTVDNAIVWGQELIDNMNKVNLMAQEIISYMKDISEKRNYCKCDSKCEIMQSGKQKSACQANCIFQQTEASTGSFINSEGITETFEIPASCSCVRQGCDGEPCQLMIDLLIGPSGSLEDICAQGAIGFPLFYIDMSNSIKDFMVFILPERRSDIIKKLSYSRKKMDECSQLLVELGADVVKTLSCSRSYGGSGFTEDMCYGYMKQNLTENWFCIKRVIK